MKNKNIERKIFSLWGEVQAIPCDERQNRFGKSLLCLYKRFIFHHCLETSNRDLNTKGFNNSYDWKE